MDKKEKVWNDIIVYALLILLVAMIETLFVGKQVLTPFLIDLMPILVSSWLLSIIIQSFLIRKLGNELERKKVKIKIKGVTFRVSILIILTIFIKIALSLFN